MAAVVSRAPFLKVGGSSGHFIILDTSLQFVKTPLVTMRSMDMVCRFLSYHTTSLLLYHMTETLILILATINTFMTVL